MSLAADLDRVTILTQSARGAARSAPLLNIARARHNDFVLTRMQLTVKQLIMVVVLLLLWFLRVVMFPPALDHRRRAWLRLIRALLLVLNTNVGVIVLSR